MSHASDGTEAAYDRLIVATGSTPFMIPIPGNELDGVIAFRDISDVDTMLEVAATENGKAVVIGGGLLGLEAANGLLKQGMDVTVVHLMDCLMERQLDKPAAALLKASLEQKGLQVPDGGADRSDPGQGQGRKRYASRTDSRSPRIWW